MATVNGGLGSDFIHMVGDGHAQRGGTTQVTGVTNNDDTINGGLSLVLGLSLDLGDDTIYGAGGNDTITGFSGSDSQFGESGNDRFRIFQLTDLDLLGVAGGDDFVGGTGTDTLDFGGLLVGVLGGPIDLSNQTIDSVEQLEMNGSLLTDLDFIFTAAQLGGFSLISGDNTDNTLSLSAAGVVDLSNAVITSIEQFVGTSGADTFTFTGVTTGQNVTLGAGNDRGVGGSGGDSLSGGTGNDRLIGGAGGDVLSGGDGTDTLSYEGSTGGSINVNIGGDTASGGDAESDTISEFENLVGGESADTLTGSSGNNIIVGRAGADLMSGGAGNDTYDVDNNSDVVVELDGGGSDLVYTRASSFALSAGSSVERLVAFVDAGAVNLTGNELRQSISGNGAANVLRSGAGNDRMDGLGGADIFDFNSAADSSAATGIDTVADFSSAQGDKIDLTGFGDLTFIGAAAYTGVAGQVRFFGNSVLRIDLDGNKIDDVQIYLVGVASIAAGDLLLI